MTNEDRLKEIGINARKIVDVRPCDETLDGNGVQILIKRSEVELYMPAFTRLEFIEQFKNANQGIIELSDALNRAWDRENVLREALEFYASNYAESMIDGIMRRSPGHTAREALEKAKHE